VQKVGRRRRSEGETRTMVPHDISRCEPTGSRRYHKVAHLPHKETLDELPRPVAESECDN